MTYPMRFPDSVRLTVVDTDTLCSSYQEYIKENLKNNYSYFKRGTGAYPREKKKSRTVQQKGIYSLYTSAKLPR